jgi:hypothetical protein
MIYTHVAACGPTGTKSPLDRLVLLRQSMTQTPLSLKVLETNSTGEKIDATSKIDQTSNLN